MLIHVQRQLTVLDTQEQIKSKEREELGDRQREMVLREQMKAIQKELGEGDDSGDLEELAERLAKLDLPPAVRKETDRELGRMRRIGRESMESQVIRTFLETVAELPWSERSAEKLDIQEAERILDEDHYGLQDVKDRVLEFLAVRQLRLARDQRATPPPAPGEDPVDGDAPEGAGGHGSSSAAREVGELGSPSARGVNDAAEPHDAGEKKKEKLAKGPILLFIGPVQQYG